MPFEEGHKFYGKIHYKHKAETIEKIRQSNLGKKQDIHKVLLRSIHLKEYYKNHPEKIISIKNKMKGKKPWNTGKHRPELSGSNNPNWKGGRTKGMRKLRTTLEYKKWRNAVFERDNYTCVWCGDNRGGNLEADHINPTSEFPESIFDINNGRTLCEDCHKQTDTWGFKQVNNLKMNLWRDKLI